MLVHRFTNHLTPAVVQTDVLMIIPLCEMVVVLLSRCDMLFQENFGACSTVNVLCPALLQADVPTLTVT